MRNGEFLMKFLCERLRLPLEFLCTSRPLSVAPLVYADTRRKATAARHICEWSDHAGRHSTRLGARFFCPVHCLRFRLRSPL